MSSSRAFWSSTILSIGALCVALAACGGSNTPTDGEVVDTDDDSDGDSGEPNGSGSSGRSGSSGKPATSATTGSSKATSGQATSGAARSGRSGGTAQSGSTGSAGRSGKSGASGQSGAGETGSSGDTGAPGTTGTMHVSGRFLHDRCGERVVVRGVNEMIVWSPSKVGVPEYAEIAKTGANAVRIVWASTGKAAQLDTAIENAVKAQLIPIIENHDATGDLTKLPAVIDYWTQDDVVAVLKKHAPYLLLNIANESGNAETTETEFASAYETAIDRIRAVGVDVPLIIDASSWGQDIDILQAVGPQLIEHDPKKNLMFSVHMWWHDPTGARVKKELAESVDMELPLMVGEFAQHAVYQCDKAPFAYKTLMEEAQKQSIGWLAWSWGAVTNKDCADQGSFDMTDGGTFGSWKETWGEEVSVTDPNSIKNTSVRPYSMVNGECKE